MVYPQFHIPRGSLLKVLFVASEVVPLAKTGGLADVVSSLASHLKGAGHEVRIIIPYYGLIKDKGIETTPVLPSMGVNMGPGHEEWCSVHEAKGTGDVKVWLIEHDHYFNRDGLYHDKAFTDFQDNPRRYAFLSRAALQVAIDTNFSPDVIHVHDWQAALVAAYQKVWFWDNPVVGKATTVLTIHNAQYQGVYDGSHYQYFGFGDEHYESHKFENFGDVNMLKAGIHFSDVVNTVSPTHADEISAPFSNFGIAPYLNAKNGNFKGILNGIDYDEWSPERDSLIPSNFSSENLAGKGLCKSELQKKFNLDVRPGVPVIGIVGRLVDQKGYQLLMPKIDQIMAEMDVQFAFVGSGDPDLEGYILHLSDRYKGKFGSWIGYSNELAHLVEAGSDLFLMPSIFEPCGLNQIYSLKYGTLPLVRAVGGLADTVVNYNPLTGEGTGFSFEEPSPEALFGTIKWAVDTWYEHPKHFAGMRHRAMNQDFSWEISGAEYLNFYHQSIGAREAYNSLSS